MESISKFILEGPTGNIASIIGVIISLIGFGVTIYNVLKSKNAAQAAEQAVQKVREDILKIDMVSDLSTAISTMEEIRRLHREGTWIILPDRYSALKKQLISVRSANPNISNDYKTSIQSAIQHFTNIEFQIEKSLAKNDEPTNVHKLNEIVGQQIDNLVEILVEVRSNIGG